MYWILSPGIIDPSDLHQYDTWNLWHCHMIILSKTNKCRITDLTMPLRSAHDGMKTVRKLPDVDTCGTFRIVVPAPRRNRRSVCGTGAEYPVTQVPEQLAPTPCPPRTGAKKSRSSRTSSDRTR